MGESWHGILYFGALTCGARPGEFLIRAWRGICNRFLQEVGGALPGCWPRGKSLSKDLALGCFGGIVEKTLRGSLMVLGCTRLPRLPVVAELPLQRFALIGREVQGFPGSTAKNPREEGARFLGSTVKSPERRKVSGFYG